MTNKVKKDPFNNLVFLDDEERELSEFIENTDLPRASKEVRKKATDEFRAAMKNTFGKTRPISLRVNEVDLMKVKAQALEQGLPYQTLIGSILHQYVSNVSRNRTGNQCGEVIYNVKECGGDVDKSDDTKDAVKFSNNNSSVHSSVSC